jgi:hypothetical protein
MSHVSKLVEQLQDFKEINLNIQGGVLVQHGAGATQLRFTSGSIVFEIITSKPLKDILNGQNAMVTVKLQAQ